jgi:hypothetical protein
LPPLLDKVTGVLMLAWLEPGFSADTSSMTQRERPNKADKVRIVERISNNEIIYLFFDISHFDYLIHAFL